MIREDCELLAELARLNSDVVPLAMRVIDGSATVQEQRTFAQRLIAAVSAFITGPMRASTWSSTQRLSSQRPGAFPRIPEPTRCAICAHEHWVGDEVSRAPATIGAAGEWAP